MRKRRDTDLGEDDLDLDEGDEFEGTSDEPEISEDDGNSHAESLVVVDNSGDGVPAHRYVLLGKKVPRLAIIILTLAAFFAALFVASRFVLNYLEAQSIAQSPQDHFQRNPELVFREVHFQKYLVWGRPVGTIRQFETLVVYHVEGTARLVIPLQELRIDENETDYVAREIRVIVPLHTMIKVDVDIPDQNVTEVERLSAVPIPPEQVERLSNAAGAFGGAIAGWVGFRVGGLVGESVGRALPVPGAGFIGRLSGNILGGAGAGAGGYIATKNFAERMLGNLDFSVDPIDRDAIIERARALVGLEILTGASMWEASAPTGPDEILNVWRQEVEVELQMLFQRLNWVDIDIVFEEIGHTDGDQDGGDV